MRVLGILDSDSRRLVRDFCHDARQPLATIGVLLECLRGSALDEDKALRLDQIADQVAELSSMADRVLLDEVRPGLLRLGRELAEVVDGFRLVHRGTVELVLDEDVIVVADALAVRRILRNLLDNARQAQPGGRIAVGLRRTADRCEISIADEGPARATWGVGIGLGIVGRLADQNEARVTIRTFESGSVVSLSMRCAAPVPTARPA